MADFLRSLFNFNTSSPKARSSPKAPSSPKSPKKTRSSLKTKTNKRMTLKKVKFHSPNEVKEYDLENEEIRSKRRSPPKKNGLNCIHNVFPCMHRGVWFETKEEWNEYQLNKRTKNASTGYRTVKKHHIDTMNHLRSQGKSARRIPMESRLYNNETGDIYDSRLRGEVMTV